MRIDYQNDNDDPNGLLYIEADTNGRLTEHIVLHDFSVKDLQEDLVTYDDLQKEMDNIDFISQFHIREVRAAIKCIWKFDTGKIGYDTYSSGLFCAYIKSDAIKMAEKKDKQFNGIDPTRIGKVIIGCSDIPLGEIMCDFHTG